MKNSILFILLIVYSVSFAQEKINQTDENGLRQGLWKKYHTNGKLKYEGSFENNKPIGEWKRYHENAKPQAVITYSEQSDSTMTQLYNMSGQKIAEGNFIDKKKVGLWKFYVKKQLTSESNYTQGMKDGLSKTYYPSGELLEESEWITGYQMGNQTSYYKNGNPFMKCKYYEDKREGPCHSYYSDGEIEMEASFKKDKRHGKWRHYDNKGVILYILDYDNGKLLNPEVLDSIEAKRMNEMEQNKGSFLDPEKYIQNPSEFLMRNQNRQ